LIPVAVTNNLAEFSRSQGATFYTTALAALKMLILHYVKHNDIYVGTLVAGRDRVELERLIGLFINTIVLRTDLSGDPTFPELLNRVRGTVEEGITHQDLHFQQVVEVARPKRDSSRPPLYGINFIYQRDFVKPLEFAGLTMVPHPSKSPGAIYDLNFFMVERADGWRLSCEYNYDLYEAESVSRMIGQLRNLLEEIARNPHRRLSEFPFPKNAGEPVPPMVPRTQVTSADHSSQGPGGHF
jgi:non-ribosomal peptide synthetase component F